MKKHVFLVGAKSLGAYGGYETFINKLTEYHKNNPKQLEKDKLKDSIAQKNGIDILRFETGGEHYDEEKIISEIRKKIVEF